MPRRPYDPLAFVPPPSPIRDKLAETEALVRKFRVLLDLVERLDAAGGRRQETVARRADFAGGEGTGHVA